MTALPIRIAPEVADALTRGTGVVALESTIITHGMPLPRNLETARACEAAVRAAGAVPATIAVMEGVLLAVASSSSSPRWIGSPFIAFRISGPVSVSYSSRASARR